jgi:chromosomal replication initiator protein
MPGNASVIDARTARLHRTLDETRQLLVEHVDRAIGELQDVLPHVAAIQTPLGHQRAVATPQEAAGAPPRPVLAGTVMAVTADYYGVTVEELCGPRRDSSLCRARHIAMYLCRELTDLSLPRIGRQFDRDHTTVMHGERKIRQEIKDGKCAANHVADLTALIVRQVTIDAPQPRGTQVKSRRRVA